MTERTMIEYGGEFHWKANLPYLTGGGIPESWQLFRSGRDALRAAAMLAGRKRVLMPALCCASMIVPFEQNGCEVIFYRLREDLSADREGVLRKLRDGDILLYMPYFGIRPFPDAFLRELRESGRELFFLEDRTQDILVGREGGGFEPDATAASLRKWAAIPEGGMLETKLGKVETVLDPRFGDIRRAAMEEKSLFLENGDEALKEESYRMVKQAEALLDLPGAPVGIRPEMRALLESLDFAAILEARRRNLRYLRERLRPAIEKGSVRLLTPEPEKSGLYLPVLLEHRDAVQQELVRRRIYFPVSIWPEPAQARGVCPVCRRVTEHMMPILCDQRWGEADLDFFADNVLEIVRETEGERHED